MSDDSSVSSHSAFLIWEDADHETWWLARSHDQDINYVVARDTITAHFLVLRQKDPAKSYKVIAAVPVKSTDDLARGIAEAKRLAIRWIGDSEAPTLKQSVNRWRWVRWSKIAVREVPLAVASLCVGVVLALVVSSFFIATDLAGWSMILVGTVFGTLFGWVLKWVADQKLASLTGPIGRFFTVTGSVTIGALCTVVLFMILYGG